MPSRHASGRAPRALAVVALTGVLAMLLHQSQSPSPAPPRASVRFWEAEVEGGGAARTARKARSLLTLARVLSEHRADAVGHSYDTNAIGESWGSSAMGHWLDRAGAAASMERLEEELAEMKIGRRDGRDLRRAAMRLKRLQGQQARRERPENGMLHWADRPSALESPELLEEQLASMRIGGVSATEGRRRAAALQRRARLQRLEGARAPGPSEAAAQPARKALSPARRPQGPVLASSHFDINAVGEVFQAASAGEAGQERTDLMEGKLRSVEIGRRRSPESQRHRAAMRQRRWQLTESLQHSA